MGKMGQFPACYAVHQLGGHWEILASPCMPTWMCRRPTPFRN